jgi:hypothetical protein
MEEVPTGIFPAGFHLEEEMANKHLNFLSLTLVIVIIKVKIIIRKRLGTGSVHARTGPPQEPAYPLTEISRSPSATVSVPPVAARISSTVRPGAISRSRNPVPVGSNSP